MGWKGIAFGGLAGGLFGKGYIGAIFGALLGHRIEEIGKSTRLNSSHNS